jgi:hypothetical protein
MRFLLEGARLFKKASTSGLNHGPHVGLVRPVMNHHQIIVTAFCFLQKALQQITFITDANN